MNKFRNSVLNARQLCAILLFTLLMAAFAQAQTPAARENIKLSDVAREVLSTRRFRLSLAPASFRLMPGTSARTTAETSTRPTASSSSNTNVMPMAASQVMGTGTLGRLTKWTGFNTNSFIGDSTIFEGKGGLVGVGTDVPTSKLTVAGMIETTLGGLKFPDGTVQTTAGLASIFHDATLQGNGTSDSPLGVAVPLILSGSVSNGNGVITVTNTAAGGPAVFAVGGNSSPTFGGGSGLLSLGGTGTNSQGGAGLIGFGGSASGASGGTGGSLIGGVSTSGSGGDGLFAIGALGVGTGKKGGRGILAIPGGGAGGATPGLAGEFVGDVSISGNVSKGGGSFKIDHPLDPENKYLYHSFVESPDMKNIYDGVVKLDSTGEAIVELPEWFDALNRDFRYLLTAIGAPAPSLYIAEKIANNRFKIAGGQPGMEVSWQVTGIRQDAYANKHRIPVEQEKAEEERGFYLHPESFNQPEDRGIAWARHSETMQQLKQRRIEAEHLQKQQKQISRRNP